MAPLHGHGPISALLAVAAPAALLLLGVADALSLRSGGSLPPADSGAAAGGLPESFGRLAVDSVERYEATLQYAGIGDTPEQSSALLRNMTWVRSEERFFHAKSDGKVPSAAVNNSLPIKWLHIPKTGSSFVNTLINVPGVCPGLPGDIFVSRDTFGDSFLGAFQRTYEIRKACPGFDITNSVQQYGGFGHSGLGSGSAYMWEPKLHGNKKRLFTFLRQPEQRIISAYNDLLFAHGAGMSVRNAESSHAWNKTRVPFLREYAKTVSGCSVRMMTRGGYACGSPEAATRHEINEAKRRLREDFAFVGITEWWQDSMCLFSKMFDTECHSHQFQDTRTGINGHHATDKYQTWGLVGVKDRADRELYAEARRIFRKNVELYGVSTHGCAKCFREAGYDINAYQSGASRAAPRDDFDEE